MTNIEDHNKDIDADKEKKNTCDSDNDGKLKSKVHHFYITSDEIMVGLFFRTLWI